MPKRKETTPRDTTEAFYQRGIYRTSHRKFARLSRGSRTDDGASYKKRRTTTTTAQHGLSDDHCRTLFSNRNIQDPSLSRLLRASKTPAKIPPKTTTTMTRARASKQTFKKTASTKSRKPTAATQSFEVEKGKHLFLVQGNMSSSGSSRFDDYLYEVYAHGVNGLLPSVGRAKELLPTPMMSGNWNVGTTKMGTHNTVLQQQSDWEGKRVRLYHASFPADVVYETKSAFRVVRTKLYFARDTGSLALVPFDGFESYAESQNYQGALAAAVLDSCRTHSGWTHSPVVCFPSVPVGCFRSCGGVSIAVDIRAAESSSPCYMKLTSYEATNELVAAELVFSLGCTTSRKSEDSSVTGLPLTTRNVQKHARCCAQTVESTKPTAVSKLVTQQKAERRNQVDLPAGWPNPDNFESHTPTAYLRPKHCPLFEATKRDLSTTNRSPLGSLQPAVPVHSAQYKKDDSPELFKKATKNETREKQGASMDNANMDKGSLYENDNSGLDLCLGDLSPSKIPRSNKDSSTSPSFSVQLLGGPSGAQGETFSSTLHDVEHPSPHDIVNRELFPSPPAPVADGSGRDFADPDSIVFFHDAYFGLHDPEDNIPITDYQDEDLVAYTRETQNGAEFHDVMFGQAKSTTSVVLEWVCGLVLLAVFFGCAYYARPILHSLTNCSSAPDVDLDSMILAGEGFAEFVYHKHT